MKKKVFLLSLIVIFSASILVSGCSENTDNLTEENNSNYSEMEADYGGETVSAQDELIEQYVRSDSQGDVWAEAAWITPELYELVEEENLIDKDELEASIIFDLILSTHSGDLMDFSYEDNIILRTDSEDVKPADITFLSKSNHHPRMLIKFDKSNISDSDTMELLLTNLRDAQKRSFIW